MGLSLPRPGVLLEEGPLSACPWDFLSYLLFTSFPRGFPCRDRSALAHDGQPRCPRWHSPAGPSLWGRCAFPRDCPVAPRCSQYSQSCLLLCHPPGILRELPHEPLECGCLRDPLPGKAVCKPWSAGLTLSHGRLWLLTHNQEAGQSSLAVSSDPSTPLRPAAAHPPPPRSPGEPLSAQGARSPSRAPAPLQGCRALQPQCSPRAPLL